ncbi:MAG: PQQ-binding-like beta-propeller repeat protein, partial [Polyangiales bacterium]
MEIARACRGLTSSAFAALALAASACADLAGLGDRPVVDSGDGAVDTASDGTFADTVGELGADAEADADADAATDSSPPSDAPDAAEAETSVLDATIAPVPGCELGGMQADAAWPMARYCPSERNRSPLAGPGSTPTFRWAVTFPAIVWTAPTIGADGTLYVSSEDGVVTALAPTDGHTIWTHALDGGTG